MTPELETLESRTLPSRVVPLPALGERGGTAHRPVAVMTAAVLPALPVLPAAPLAQPFVLPPEYLAAQASLAALMANPPRHSAAWLASLAEPTPAQVVAITVQGQQLAAQAAASVAQAMANAALPAQWAASLEVQRAALDAVYADMADGFTALKPLKSLGAR